MNTIINFENVSFTYPEAKTPALSNLSFKIRKGSWTSIIGHNGSGKSTITKLIDGLLIPDDKPDSRITIDGLVLNANNIWQIRDRVGIVFQNPENQFVGATVEDDIAFGLENRGVERTEMQKKVERVLKDVGMEHYRSAEPSTLSGGQKQRIAIAGILAVSPEIIILDEATSMLDPQGRLQILKLVKDLKKEKNFTVISITHDVNEAVEADEVLVLNDGKMVSSGAAKEVFKNSALLKEIGLEKPFFYQMKSHLKEAGISVPEDTDTQEKLVNFLCRLNSKM